MKRNWSLSKVALLMILVLLAGCAGFGLPPQKSVATMTPTEKANYAVVSYNTVYEDTKRQGADPDLTPAQIKVYNAKRALLAEAWPVIKRYDAWARTGSPLQPGDAEQLSGFIDQLVRAGTK